MLKLFRRNTSVPPESKSRVELGRRLRDGSQLKPKKHRGLPKVPLPPTPPLDKSRGIKLQDLKPQILANVLQQQQQPERPRHIGDSPAISSSPSSSSNSTTSDTSSTTEDQAAGPFKCANDVCDLTVPLGWIMKIGQAVLGIFNYD